MKLWKKLENYTSCVLYSTIQFKKNFINGNGRWGKFRVADLNCQRQQNKSDYGIEPTCTKLIYVGVSER